MAAPVTAKFEDLVLQVETETPGTYATLCGMKGFSIERSMSVDEDEVPADCADESLPYQVVRSARSLSVSITADSVWSTTSHEIAMDWIYSGLPKNIRVRHVRALVGDTEYETGPALLTKSGNSREKGKQIQMPIEIQFVGTPTRTAKA